MNDNNPSAYNNPNAYMYDPNLNVAHMNPNHIFQPSHAPAHAFASQAPAHISASASNVTSMIVASVAGGG